MEPNKLEQEFSTKLNTREISPSENSWDRLDAMLTVAENQRPVRRLNWLYIAAGILGFVFLTTIFIFQKDDAVQDSENSVVIQGAEKNIIKKTPPLQPFEDRIVTPRQTRLVENEAQKSAKSSGVRQMSPKSPKKLQSVQIAEHQTPTTSKKHDTQSSNDIASQPEVNVDELLASVETTTQPTKQSVKIDAAALLSQVDSELDLSFREKVIRSVGKNYRDVKVALANRNTINN